MSDERTCMNCRFAVHVDFGWSNYTVEGATFHCAKKAHPDGEFDEFYGEDKRLKFAAECPSFEAGSGVSMDVDRENEPDLTPEELEVWKMYLHGAVGRPDSSGN
jgi:hypothetical protein